MDIITLKADTEDISLRADVFVAAKCSVSRSTAAKMIDSGNVTENGHAVSKNRKIKGGEIFEVSLSEVLPCAVEAEDIPLDIAYEDSDVIVVNKPAGMVVHPAPGHTGGTLVSALLWHCRNSLSEVGGVERQGIVHRIDRDTTGLIAAAKNDKAHISLASQLAEHTMHREYYAVLIGNLPDLKGTVDKPIARHKTDRKKMAVASDFDRSARRAVTHWEVLSRNSGFTFAKMVLETGRTHQIRVHMASIGHPVLGDPVYGGDKTLFQKHHPSLFKGQMLHAGKLIFTHPSTGETITVSAPLPDNFRRVLELLEIASGIEETPL